MDQPGSYATPAGVEQYSIKHFLQISDLSEVNTDFLVGIILMISQIPP
jgi:hypothetical protein